MSNIVKFPVQQKTAAQVVAENRVRRLAETKLRQKEIDELKQKIAAFNKSDDRFSE